MPATIFDGWVYCTIYSNSKLKNILGMKMNYYCKQKLQFIANTLICQSVKLVFCKMMKAF